MEYRIFQSINHTLNTSTSSKISRCGLYYSGEMDREKQGRNLYFCDKQIWLWLILQCSLYSSVAYTPVWLILQCGLYILQCSLYIYSSAAYIYSSAAYIYSSVAYIYSSVAYIYSSVAYTPVWPIPWTIPYLRGTEETLPANSLTQMKRL